MHHLTGDRSVATYRDRANVHDFKKGGLPLMAVVMMLATAPAPLLAGPHHWGFGFPYLAAVEEVGGQRRLAVYEPPLRAKDCAWPTRWLDVTTDWSGVLPGGIAIGNFWPTSPGTEYLAAVRQEAGSLRVDVYAAPECFAVHPWAKLSTSLPIAVSGTFLGATAGDLLGLGRDQLMLAITSASLMSPVCCENGDAPRAGDPIGWPPTPTAVRKDA